MAAMELTLTLTLTLTLYRFALMTLTRRSRARRTNGAKQNTSPDVIITVHVHVAADWAHNKTASRGLEERVLMAMMKCNW